MSRALHFYKVIWQYLWLHKPENVFSGENAFIVDAHFFLPQLFDTLTFLPHVQDMESLLEDSADLRSIV